MLKNRNKIGNLDKKYMKNRNLLGQNHRTCLKKKEFFSVDHITHNISVIKETKCIFVVHSTIGINALHRVGCWTQPTCSRILFARQRKTLKIGTF